MEYNNVQIVSTVAVGKSCRVIRQNPVTGKTEYCETSPVLHYVRHLTGEYWIRTKNTTYRGRRKG